MRDEAELTIRRSRSEEGRKWSRWVAWRPLADVMTRRSSSGGEVAAIAEGDGGVRDLL